MSTYKPRTREELINYCLRQLGDPVIEINLDPDQIEDRVEEALQYYREFHLDATEQIYLVSQVTASTLNLQSGNGTAFVAGDLITGQNSNAICTVTGITSDNTLSVKGVTGTFIDGEPIVSNKSSQTGILSSNSSIVLGSYDKKYFDVSENIVSITKCLQFNSGSSGMGLFDIRYQLMLNNMPTLTSLDLGYYVQLKTYLQTLNDLLVGQKQVRFKRHTNKLYIDWDWKADVTIGDYVVVEAYSILDPDVYPEVYGDMWLKKYLTALLKKQWGINMKKFEGVLLPGGVTLNGQQIYQEAVEELEELRKDCQETFQLPIDFYVG